MKLLKISILILLCSTLTLHAQEKQHVFSLDEAIAFALEHNKTIQSSEKDIEVSQKRYWQAVAAGLPQISATADYTTMFNYNMSMKTEFAEINMTMKDQSNLKGNFQQLIFNGQYLQGIQISKVVQQLSQQSYQLNELDVKENVTNAYYLILIVEESKTIVEQNMEDINKIMQHTQNMYDVGMAEITDVDQLKITVSQLKNALTSLENSIALNYNLLRFHLGLSSTDNITLTDKLDYFLGKELYQTLAGSSFDVEQNIQYQMIGTQERLSQKNVGMQRWSFAPSIFGVYSYTEKIMKPDFDMSPKQMLNFTMSVPIFSSWDRMSKLGQAKIELEKAQLTKDLVKDQLLLQENQLRNDLKNAIDNYILQSENVEVAQRVFQNYRNKYEFGMLSSLQLTQANSNYLTAQTNYLTAVMNLLQAQLKLQKLLNTL
jgi:outer membrane protein TolC